MSTFLVPTIYFMLYLSSYSLWHCVQSACIALCIQLQAASAHIEYVITLNMTITMLKTYRTFVYHCCFMLIGLFYVDVTWPLWCCKASWSLDPDVWQFDELRWPLTAGLQWFDVTVCNSRWTLTPRKHWCWNWDNSATRWSFYELDV